MQYTNYHKFNLYFISLMQRIKLAIRGRLNKICQLYVNRVILSEIYSILPLFANLISYTLMLATLQKEKEKSHYENRSSVHVI